MSLNPSPENNFLAEMSVGRRIIISLLSNFIRGGLSFLTGVFIARGLGPYEYGNYVFLIGTFIALQQLLDMGTARAFFTFISQRKRGRGFIKLYLLWQLAQFLLVIFVIAIFLPDSWISSIWMDQNRTLVLASFSAVFLQHGAWNTIILIGEANRLTQKVQVLWLNLVAIHFVVVLALWSLGLLSLSLLFTLIIIEYLAGLLLAEKILSVRTWEEVPFVYKSVFREYIVYCAPLVIYSWLDFFKEFADRWLLQNFGGPLEQGFYGVGQHFALVCSLFTIAIHKILWKEIAEAREKQDLERVRMLYKRATNFLLTASAGLSGFFVPWSQEIIELLLGVSFLGGASALAIMLIMPIHQSMTQITGALYLASHKTKEQTIIKIIFMVIHIPVTYFVLASGDEWIPGFGLGSYGMALKMVILQIISVNIMVWWISRDYGWKYDWSSQFIIISMMFSSGWVCHEIVIALGEVLPINMFFQFGIALLVYFSMVGWFVWRNPQLAGMTLEDFRGFSEQLKRALKIKT